MCEMMRTMRTMAAAMTQQAAAMVQQARATDRGVRKLETNENNDNNNQNNPRNQRVTPAHKDWIDFLKAKPPTFKGVLDFKIVDKWLKEVEKAFRVMTTTEEQNVSFGRNFLAEVENKRQQQYSYKRKPSGPVQYSNPKFSRTDKGKATVSGQPLVKVCPSEPGETGKK
ncbi:putative retrotransposon gag domain-containing protein [Senna tora]|uniref:Putative retrotransposon gag domain-containing protein n=1 Tax=Senna tora TaxID=362788 RepID=A0A834XCD6_9FABA|nr:putative retrotransposon gag domain-containing protein [Senna tora]